MEKTAGHEHAGAHEKWVLVRCLKSTTNSTIEMNQPKIFTNRSTQFTRFQEIVVRNFIDVWDLSMPYHDMGAALNCGECNALHEMLIAFGATQAALALMEAHLAGDDEGDAAAQVSFKAHLSKTCP